MVKLIFFLKMANGEINFFFRLVSSEVKANDLLKHIN